MSPWTLRVHTSSRAPPLLVFFPLFLKAASTPTLGVLPFSKTNCSKSSQSSASSGLAILADNQHTGHFPFKGMVTDGYHKGRWEEKKVGERKRFQTPQRLTVTTLVHGFGFPPERGARGKLQWWRADGVKMAPVGGRWTPCLTWLCCYTGNNFLSPLPPSPKNSKNCLTTPTHQAEAGKAHTKAGRRAWVATLPWTLPPVLQSPELGGNSDLELLPEEWRVWTPYLAPQLFKICALETSPQNTWL